MKNKLSCLIVITVSLVWQQSYASCYSSPTADLAYKSADLVANIFVLRNQIPNKPNTVEAVVHEAWKSPAELKNKATFQIAGVSVENPKLDPGRSYNRNLDHESIRRMYFITHGAVQPNDFFDLENCPEDLRDHFYGKKLKEASRERTTR